MLPSKHGIIARGVVKIQVSSNSVQSLREKSVFSGAVTGMDKHSNK
jgi:hypothetical protein